MVTRAYFDDELAFRRDSSRGHGYPLSRELPPAPSPYNTAREHHLSNHETRNGNSAADPENNSRPRSRIPVACGRCRKRKIRCSGDLGTGLPCTNCKSAGNENCQFLRVSSTEATMKNEPNDFNNFEPPSAAARLQCRMVPYGHHAYVQQTTPVDAYYQRNTSLSGYQYPANAKYYTMPPFEYQDDGDFVIQQSYPAAMSSDQLLSSNFPVPSVSRAWTPTPQSSKNAPMFLEQESSFNHGQLPYHTYPLRPAISPETKSSSLGGQILTGSLPAPESGNNRVLPFPAGNRQQVASYLHSSSNGLPTSQGGYQSYDGLASTNTQSRKSINSSSISENASLSSSYLPYSSSSPESLASSQRAYSSQTLSQQNAEIYTPNSEGLFHANESTDSSYGTSSETAKRGSQSSQGGPEGAMQAMSNGNLANGHAYVPYNNQSSYPAPPMNIHHAPHRRPSTGISAS
ncbi:putative transcriptional regulatory protein [Lachnellula willkommii]|uniref:Putative transcriptional regulatory protein n=1 Tax=Lachnellula willkommii TaxID=215461 RepID=A0A559ME61_9HELO|nr:putative transcriptional regulatory protein [Lachnellula willkommii]